MQVTTSCSMRRSGRSIEHVARRHGWDMRLGRTVGDRLQAGMVVAAEAAGQRAVAAVAKALPQASEGRQPRLASGCSVEQDRDQAIAPRIHVRPGQLAFALAAPALADGEQAAEAAVGGAIGRVDQKRGALIEIEPAADHEPDSGLLGGLMRPHHPGQGIAVRDAEGGHPKLVGADRTAPPGSKRRAGTRNAIVTWSSA